MTTETAIIWRAARRDELEIVAASERECFMPPRGSPWSPEILERLFGDEKYHLWLGFIGETAVGHAIFWSVGAEGEIDRIGVVQSWRRRGIAQFGLQAMLRELESAGVRRVFLEVREDNVAARALYEEAAFGIVGRRAHYYDDGVAALVLKREIGAASTCGE